MPAPGEAGKHFELAEMCVLCEVSLIRDCVTAEPITRSREVVCLSLMHGRFVCFRCGLELCYTMEHMHDIRAVTSIPVCSLTDSLS